MGAIWIYTKLGVYGIGVYFALAGFETSLLAYEQETILILGYNDFLDPTDFLWLFPSGY
jgi:hypothetical protein